MIYRSLLFTCLWIGVSVVTVAQTRIGVGLTYDDSEIIVSDQSTITTFIYFADSSRQVAPTFSVEHFLTDRVSFLFDVQLIGKKHYHTRVNGFLFRHFLVTQWFTRGSFVGRYHPKDWLFVGGGATMQYDGRYERREISDGIVDLQNITERIGTRRFGMQVQAGAFYKGLELQLAYYFSPFYREKIQEYGRQTNLLRNRFSPTLRYSYNIGKKEKRRRGR